MHGVWANQNSECVVTDNFLLIFHRMRSEIFSLLSIKHNADYKMIGIAQFDGEQKSCQAKALNYKNGELVFNNYRINEPNLGSKVTLINEGNNLSLKFLGFNIEKLTFIEKIETCKPYEMPKANADNVGECLRIWGIGTAFKRENNLYYHTINTDSHLYTFTLGELEGRNVVYCRAARAIHTEKGTVFAQNIRLMANADEFTVRMPDNNLEVVVSKLVVKEEDFRSDACTYGENGIYWSLKEVSENEIVLNGCGGEEYINPRPMINSNEKIEWFRSIIKS